MDKYYTPNIEVVNIEVLHMLNSSVTHEISKTTNQPKRPKYKWIFQENRYYLYEDIHMYASPWDLEYGKLYQKGERIGSYENNLYYILETPADGYFSWSCKRETTEDDYRCRGRCFCLTLKDAVQCNYQENKYVVVQDPFNNEKVLSHVCATRIYDSPLLGFDLYHNTPSLIIDAGARIRRNHISFLFKDKSSLNFIINNQLLVRNNSYIAVPLFEKEFHKLISEDISLIRITYFGTDLVTDYKEDTNNPLPHRRVNSWGNEIFKNFGSEFLSIIEGFNYTWKEVEEEVVVGCDGSRITKDITSRDSCYVYLMEDTTNGAYKIGISKDPQYREKTLQSDKPFINMLGNKCFPSRQIASAIESALHKTYASKHLRGEWFKLSDSEVSQILETLGN